MPNSAAHPTAPLHAPPRSFTTYVCAPEKVHTLC